MGFISEIVQGSGWKNFMKYMYGWGASLVLLGALFKLMYWPGAGIMLSIGMLAEVIIFFFSAFEPIHEEVDWTLVYPELAGMTDEEELRKYRRGTGLSGGIDTEDIKELIASVVAATRGVSLPASGQPVDTAQLARVMDSNQLSPDALNKLSAGLARLTETTNRLADISEAVIATNQYSESVRRASQSISGVADQYAQSSQVLAESVNILSESYQRSAEAISQSGQSFMTGVNGSVSKLEKQLTSAGETVGQRLVASGNEMATQMGSAATSLSSVYLQMAEAMKANGEGITRGSQGYNQQLETLNKNMSALNAAHELHLQGVSHKLKETEAVYAGVEGMVHRLQSTVEQTERYSESVALLNKNIASLNHIYGNMLSAMNVMSNSK